MGPENSEVPKEKLGMAEYPQYIRITRGTGVIPSREPSDMCRKHTTSSEVQMNISQSQSRQHSAPATTSIIYIVHILYIYVYIYIYTVYIL